ncbi:hypothetical protein [Streptococcus oricebi]|uniref:Uncharacterized protein n=1 Tax=Streptococcus oricebi TaxID=1547447 RepID=A0ABS5B423_9STRE|nr:hypothetical protein [Streptococcus oricebi]MBP2623276.1 hypothetical protein [Streptococcus oricebi]
MSLFSRYIGGKIARATVDKIESSKHRDIYYILICLGLAALFLYALLYNVFVGKYTTTVLIGMLLCALLAALFLFCGMVLLLRKLKK